jgi:hypothetical protein
VNPHRRKDGLITDYCDGYAFSLHPLFSRDPQALQIILYYDEVEVVNPLGSKTSKHKVGKFYYQPIQVKCLLYQATDLLSNLRFEYFDLNFKKYINIIFSYFNRCFLLYFG